MITTTKYPDSRTTLPVLAMVHARFRGSMKTRSGAVNKRRKKVRFADETVQAIHSSSDTHSEMVQKTVAAIE